MLTDSYGGTCPNCGYDRTLLRYGSEGYFQFDACPNCAFAYGQWYDKKESDNWEKVEGRDADIWETIFEAERRVIGETFADKLLLYLFDMETLPDNQDALESVFDYSKSYKNQNP